MCSKMFDMKRAMACLVAVVMMTAVLGTACASGASSGTSPETEEASEESSAGEASEDLTERMEIEMTLKIGEEKVPVIWQENASVEALQDLVSGGPLTIEMSKYGGFEQVGPIGQSIESDDRHMDTECGDIVLYSSDQIVVFYGSNSWEYTKLGHIALPEEEIVRLLGEEDVVLTIEN